MSFTNCCNHRFIGDNHSPIRPDGYCLHCGFHPEIGSLKEANKVLREALEFYAAFKSYSMDDYQGVSGEMRSYCLLYGDSDEINDVTSYAGMRARLALAKADEIMGEKQ